MTRDLCAEWASVVLQATVENRRLCKRNTIQNICEPLKGKNIKRVTGRSSTKVMAHLWHINYLTPFPGNASLGWPCFHWQFRNALRLDEINDWLFTNELHYDQMTLIDYPQIDWVPGINIYLPFLENKPQALVFLCCLLEQSYVHSWNRWVSCSCRHLDQPPCMCLHQGSMRKSKNKGVHFKGQQVREVK